MSNPEVDPIQPNKHSFEFFRENAHLRTRTNTFSAVMRIRSNLSFAIHEYFKKNGFYYVHTPIITASDAEGAGEQFRVSTLDVKNPPLDKHGQVDFNKDFFGKNNNDPVLEPISPFLTLSSLNVNITGAGFGLMSSKRADLSLVLHDRSRLRDLAPLVSSTQFATTKIIIEYGVDENL